jgi:acetate CoA/acetoacetate CoA-transferase alpha subunit
VSHIGTNPETGKKMMDGELEVELVPQGTLAERVRAGGYGLGGVLTPTGLGTSVAEGKRVIDIDGKCFLLELPIKADFALVNARRADYIGNLTYAMTARNFNPLIAMAGEVVMVEAQEIVPVGVIAPDDVMTPSVVVDHIIARERQHG